LRKVPAKKIIPSIILSVILIFIALQFNPGEAEGRISNPTTLSDRDILYEGFFELAPEHPILGFGPRTFHDIFPFKDRLADKKVGSWHNDYVQTYLESGIIALILLFMLIITIFHKTNWIIFKPRKLIKLDSEVFALLFGIIAILLSGLTGVFLYSPILSLLFAYFVSLFSYFCYIQEEFFN
jgi:O-antigen ligase